MTAGAKLRVLAVDDERPALEDLGRLLEGSAAVEDVVLLALRRDMDLEERRQLGERFRSAEGRGKAGQETGDQDGA